jgi:hypothetical protein
MSAWDIFSWVLAAVSAVVAGLMAVPFVILMVIGTIGLIVGVVAFVVICFQEWLERKRARSRGWR